MPEPETAGAALPPAYQPRLSATWWLRNRRYLLYMGREFTAVPIAVWAAAFLVEVAGARGGQGSYRPLSGPLWVGFSLVCLAFALWHSYSFLALSGLIMRIPLGEGTVPPRLVVAASFGLLLVISALVGGLVVWGGR